jgi:tol-pal system protein YbgF
MKSHLWVSLWMLTMLFVVAGQPEKTSPSGLARPAAQIKAKADPGRAFYDQALKKYFSGDYAQARADFLVFASRYPDHPLQPNALYWLAETHYAQQQYVQAILVFKELTRRFPQSHKVPDALLKAGYAYERLGDIPNARFHLQIVLDDYPNTPAARLARERMATLARP